MEIDHISQKMFLMSQGGDIWQNTVKSRSVHAIEQIKQPEAGEVC